MECFKVWPEGTEIAQKISQHHYKFDVDEDAQEADDYSSAKPKMRPKDRLAGSGRSYDAGVGRRSSLDERLGLTDGFAGAESTVSAASAATIDLTARVADVETLCRQMDQKMDVKFAQLTSLLETMSQK